MTEEQKKYFLPGLLMGTDIYCQIFSKPDAGSYLANHTTRGKGDGNEYAINGSKIWKSDGYYSRYGILIAQTNPGVPEHKGINYFICPTRLLGLTKTPKST